MPKRKWDVSWIVAFWVIVAKELWGLVAGVPLTSVTRRRLLVYRAGSWALCAFLVWLIWHFGFVVEGTGWGDVVAVILGGGIGEVGFRFRARQVQVTEVVS
jgi:hypothetical protein